MTILLNSTPIAINYFPDCLPPACILADWVTLLRLPVTRAELQSRLATGAVVEINGNRFEWSREDE